MVRARLHIICGNCGCNDMLEHEIIRDGSDYGDHFEDVCYIKCKNCSTVHNLDDNAKKVKES